MITDIFKSRVLVIMIADSSQERWVCLSKFPTHQLVERASPHVGRRPGAAPPRADPGPGRGGLPPAVRRQTGHSARWWQTLADWAPSNPPPPLIMNFLVWIMVCSEPTRALRAPPTCALRIPGLAGSRLGSEL